MGNVPKKLKNSPLIAASVDIRFKDAIPVGTLLGKFYPVLSNDYGDLKILGPGNLPEEILKQNPNLAFLPHYQTRGKDGAAYQVQFGPKVVAFSSLAPTYEIDFDATAPVSRLLAVLELAGLLQAVGRVALRYINLFEGDKTLSQLNFTTLLDDQTDVSDCVSNLRLEMVKENFDVAVVLARDANVVNNEELVLGDTAPADPSRNGAVLDIEVADNFDGQDAATFSASSLHLHLSKAHKIATEMFFKVLKPETVKRLDASGE